MLALAELRLHAPLAVGNPIYTARIFVTLVYTALAERVQELEGLLVGPILCLFYLCRAPLSLCKMLEQIASAAATCQLEYSLSRATMLLSTTRSHEATFWSQHEKDRLGSVT